VAGVLDGAGVTVRPGPSSPWVGLAALVGVGVGRLDGVCAALAEEGSGLDDDDVIPTRDEVVAELAAAAMVDAGTADPCSAELQAAITATETTTSPPTSAARTADGLALLIC